jgi:hypothetical protein
MKTKAQAIKTVNEYASTDAGIAFRTLLICWISDLRKKNDTAATEDVLKNQGGIRELKLIVKQIGGDRISTEYDGGFGD